MGGPCKIGVLPILRCAPRVLGCRLGSNSGDLEECLSGNRRRWSGSSDLGDRLDTFSFPCLPTDTIAVSGECRSYRGSGICEPSAELNGAVRGLSLPRWHLTINPRLQVSPTPLGPPNGPGRGWEARPCP